jgi:hypothetical protein
VAAAGLQFSMQKLWRCYAKVVKVAMQKLQFAMQKLRRCNAKVAACNAKVEDM